MARKFIQVAVPEDFHLALKLWAVEHGTDFGEITRESLEMWAKAKGVKLPDSKSPGLRDTKTAYQTVSNAG